MLVGLKRGKTPPTPAHGCGLPLHAGAISRVQFVAPVTPLTVMKKVRITAIRKADYKDLQQQYENPIQHACSIQEGQVFIANGWRRPEGLCESAWESISPFVMTLAYGGENIYDGWMKNPKSAMISCNDGFRPVSFLIEALDENAE